MVGGGGAAVAPRSHGGGVDSDPDSDGGGDHAEPPQDDDNTGPNPRVIGHNAYDICSISHIACDIGKNAISLGTDVACHIRCHIPCYRF